MRHPRPNGPVSVVRSEPTDGRVDAIDAEDVGGAALLTTASFSGTAAELRDRVAELEAAGVSELAYQPAGSDIPGELARMRDALT